MARVDLNEELMKSRAYAEAEAEKIRAMNGHAPEDFHLTETGNAERLAQQHGTIIRWCEPWKKWLTWDGTRWQVDVRHGARQLAKETVRALYAEAATTDDDEYRRKLVKFAMQSESEKARRAMLELAKGEGTIPALPEQFDRDPWLLNVMNGTLDLRTGELRPHNPADYLTKLIPLHYDVDAVCPQWEAFLESIMAGRQDMIDFLWKAIGYSLTGDCREDCLFLLYGNGANGKTTFLETIRAMLADYAKKASFATFLAKEHETVRNDIAALAGARFVAAVEADKGKRFSEAVVKELTGRDTVTARFLFQEEFQFQPQLKLWLGVNHKPQVRGTDDGIWRRMRLVPFTQKFAGKDEDKHLGDKLKAELPGILAWAVRGCLAWQAEGLPLPEAIQSATGDYRKEMDMIGNFLEECCERNPQARVKSGALFTAYVKWSGDKFTNQTTFGRDLTERGIGREKVGGTLWRLGLALATEAFEE